MLGRRVTETFSETLVMPLSEPKARQCFPELLRKAFPIKEKR